MKKNIIQVITILVIAAATGFSVNYLRSDGLKIKKDWSIKSRMTTKSGKNLIIPLKQAENIFKHKQAIFIDARSETDYRKAHIKGALNLPWHEVDSKFMKIAPNLPSNKLIITYCNGQACNLSRNLAEFLIDAGFSRVKVLVNGLSVWEKAGMPIDCSDAKNKQF